MSANKNDNYKIFGWQPTEKIIFFKNVYFDQKKMLFLVLKYLLILADIISNLLLMD